MKENQPCKEEEEEAFLFRKKYFSPQTVSQTLHKDSRSDCGPFRIQTMENNRNFIK